MKGVTVQEVKELTRSENKSCGSEGRMSEQQILDHLSLLDRWIWSEGSLIKEFKFDNYYQTIAFINAVAWLAHKENHHPDISFGYRSCRVSFSTHSANGVTKQDFEQAARVDALVNNYHQWF